MRLPPQFYLKLKAGDCGVTLSDAEADEIQSTWGDVIEASRKCVQKASEEHDELVMRIVRGYMRDRSTPDTNNK